MCKSNSSIHHVELRRADGNYHRVVDAQQGAARARCSRRPVSRPRPSRDPACQPERRTIGSPTTTQDAPSRCTMVIQKLREAVWTHVCRARANASVRLASRASAERRPGMCPWGGPSGVGHLLSSRPAPTEVAVNSGHSMVTENPNISSICSRGRRRSARCGMPCGSARSGLR